MWFNNFNFRRRAALTTLYLAQCVKYSCSLVGTVRFTPRRAAPTAVDRTVFDAMREVFMQSRRR